MITVNIVCLGKLKEKYLRDAEGEYSKRLTAFCKHNIIELSPEPLPSNPSEAEIKSALSAEAKKIKAAVPNGSYVYAMCIEGRRCSSEQLSRELEQIAVRGRSNITFVIGSSYGLADEIKELADEKLSMSDMTFPHQLARIMLLEQIYRVFQINNGGKYHK